MKTFKTYLSEEAKKPIVPPPAVKPTHMALLDELGDEIEHGVEYRQLYTKETIETLDQLEALPNKSILWYPCHDVDHAGFMTDDALLYFIEDGTHLEIDGLYPAPFLSKRTRKAMSKAIKDLQGPGYTLTDNGEFNLPVIDVTSEELDLDSSGYNPELNAFCKFAKSKGYNFYWVPYASGIGPRDIRKFWSFD